MKSSKKELRVAIILSELRPGGMERVVAHLARGLAQRGIGVLVVCLEKPGALASELEYSGVQVKALNSRAGKDLRALWVLRALLRDFDASVVHVHDYASAPYAALAGRVALGRPVLFTAHGLLFEGFEGLRRRCRFFSRFFSAITAVSEEVAKRHAEYLGRGASIPVVRNGVPVVERSQELREAARVEMGLGPDDRLFLAVGNPRPEKGFEDLIDATALLGNAFGGRILTAVAGGLGDTPYCLMLKRRVEEKAVGRHFRFLGFRRDTAALYSAADVFVLSSRSEGLPMVVLEAMTAGLPVIATRVGGVPGAVDECGLLVAPGRPEELAEAMARMIQEEGLAERLGRAGKARAVERFGVDRMVDEYVNWYGRLLEGRSAS